MEKSHTIKEDVYTMYTNAIRREENEFLTSCNASMDSMLVFAGLFSAVLSALIVETRKLLVPDPHDRLATHLEAMYNHSAGLESNIYNEPFITPAGAIVINLMFFIGLSCSLLAGLGGLLVKQWARQSASDSKRGKSTRHAARAHHFAWSGLSVWRVDLIIAGVPMLLHIALLLFFFGILWWLFQTNLVVFGVLLYIISSAVFLYVGIGVASALHPDAPFKWPFSSGLVATIQLGKRIVRLILGATSAPNTKVDASKATFSHAGSDNPVDSSITSAAVHPIDKLSLRLLDEIDEDIFYKVLDNAIDGEEMSNALDHLTETVLFGRVDMRVVTPRLVHRSIRVCDELADRCCDFSNNTSFPDIIRPQQARICCRFLAWASTSARDRIVPALHTPARGIKLVRAFQDRAIHSKNLEDLKVASTALCRLLTIFHLEDLCSNLSELLCMDGTNLLIESAPIVKTPAWQSIDEYQDLVTEYVWAITESLIQYASSPQAASSEGMSSTAPSSTMVPTSNTPRISESTPLPSILDKFPPSTPAGVKVACKYQRRLLGKTDMNNEKNYVALRARMTALWEGNGPFWGSQGTSGWVFVWLECILGALLLSPQTIDGVRRTVPIAETSLAYNTWTRD